MSTQVSASSYRLFSRLLLKSFIMSDRKSLLTSISSALGEEFFSRVATTFKITGWEAEIRSWREERGEEQDDAGETSK